MRPPEVGSQAAPERIVLSGALSGDASVVVERILAATQSGHRVVLDLTDVDHCDPAAMTAILHALSVAEAGNGAVALMPGAGAPTSSVPRIVGYAARGAESAAEPT